MFAVHHDEAAYLCLAILPSTLDECTNSCCPDDLSADAARDFAGPGSRFSGAARYVARLGQLEACQS